MLLVLAVLAAIFLVPWPWSVPLVVGAAAFEAAELWFWFWWTRRRRPVVGVETLIGETATVTTGGQVRVAGELWQVRSDLPLAAGERVVIRAVEPDLTLMVEPEAN